MDNLKSFHLDQFKKDLDELGIHLEEEQLHQFMQYYEILIEWNSFMNLTAITNFDEVLKKHFIDSLSLVKVYDINLHGTKSISIIDVGTGAGFPGIPIKIVFPGLSIVLLDSLKKEFDFLKKLLISLN